MITTRFVPSPTGRLHVGNIHAALQNWLWARRNGGRFLLRLDDTDAERSTEAFADAIRTDLAWLGLAPDAVERHQNRKALHGTLEALRAIAQVTEQPEHRTRNPGVSARSGWRAVASSGMCNPCF